MTEMTGWGNWVVTLDCGALRVISLNDQKHSGLDCSVGYEARPGLQRRAMRYQGILATLWHALGQPAVACRVRLQLACTCCRPPATARGASSWQVRVAPAAGCKRLSSALIVGNWQTGVGSTEE